MIKNGAIEAGNEDDIAAYLDMRSFISENDMSISDNYRYACELIDISSFVDYYASLIYISRCEDWPHANFALWRSKEINTDNPYADNKWRYMLFDCNSSSIAFAQGDVDHNTLQWVMEMDPVFSSLWENDEFKDFFRNRLFYIRDTCFEPGEMEEYIWDYCAGKEPLLEDSWKRYYGLTNSKREEFYKTIEATIDFFYNRKNVIESWDELK